MEVGGEWVMNEGVGTVVVLVEFVEGRRNE